MNRMQLARVLAMWSACGVEDRDNVFYDKGTSKIADGTYYAYFPKFIGFGKSDKISTKLEIRDGKLLSITGYDKSGNIIEETIA